MKVADLQRYLGDLANLLRATGAKGVADDFLAIHQGLAPFQDQPLKSFADFLVRAEAFSRGEVPLTGKKKPAPTARQPKSGTADVESLIRQVADYFERAHDPDVTREAVSDLGKRLDALTKGDLVKAAERIGMVGMKTKTKAVIIAQICDWILARRGARLRIELNHREE